MHSNKTLLLSLLCSLFLLAQSQEPTFIPVQFATPTGVNNFAYAVTYWKLSLCDDQRYDQLTASFFVNLPYVPWSAPDGSVVSVSIYNDSAMTTLITTNNVSGQLAPQWTFTYSVAYGDLYIKAQAGGSASVIFTMEVQFYQPSALPSRLPTLTASGGTKQAVTFTDLTQMVSVASEWQVQTGASILLEISFCPTSQSYQLLFQTRASDGKSATALYLCVDPSEFPCNIGSSQQANQDPSSSALSSVILSTTTAQYSTIQAAVYGWGVYQGTNTFTFTMDAKL